MTLTAALLLTKLARVEKTPEQVEMRKITFFLFSTDHGDTIAL